jgi:hypothetical protein
VTILEPLIKSELVSPGTISPKQENKVDIKIVYPDMASKMAKNESLDTMEDRTWYESEA